MTKIFATSSSTPPAVRSLISAMSVSTGRVGINIATPTAQLHTVSSSATTVGAIVRGAVAQTADLLQLQNSAGQNVFGVTGDGSAIFGRNGSLLTATPLNVSFGGTYGSNTPGSPANLKWDLFNSGSGNRYGIGMSNALFEYQAGGGGSHAFYSNGTELVKISLTEMNVSVTVRAKGYKSSDGSTGATGTFTSQDGKTVTVKNGLITAIA